MSAHCATVVCVAIGGAAVPVVVVVFVFFTDALLLSVLSIHVLVSKKYS